MNWGYKILVVYIVFVIGIMFMVFRSSSEKTDLVTKDYYAEELVYQQKIDAGNRTADLHKPVSYAIDGNSLSINFPAEFYGKSLDGDVLLYCPSDENKDLKQHFSCKDSGLKIQFPNQLKGLFELHITWQADGLNYYFEKRIII